MTDIDTTTELTDVSTPVVDDASTTPTMEDPVSGGGGDDQLYEVTVNGQTIQVPERELLDGYMRQGDYTRKTQEAADLRREAENGLLILDALTKNPREAIEYMAEHYGVDFGTAAQQTQRSEPDALSYGDTYEDQPMTAQPDPRIAALEAEIRDLKQHNVQTTLNSESAKLRDKYGISDEDAAAVQRHAVLHGFPNVESAFKALHFDGAWEAKQKQDAQAAQDQAILAKKREELGVVGTQASPARGSVPDATPTESLGVRDAMMETLREMNLGVQDLTTLS